MSERVIVWCMANGSIEKTSFFTKVFTMYKFKMEWFEWCPWFQRNSLLVSSVSWLGYVSCALFCISLLLSKSEYFLIVRFVSFHHIFVAYLVRSCTSRITEHLNCIPPSYFSLRIFFFNSLFTDEISTNANNFLHIFGSWNWDNFFSWYIFNMVQIQIQIQCVFLFLPYLEFQKGKIK